ncbi:uncharacterized protein [Leptinotarsa decemlineata]|uniref:uncharacterized protein n=1 Tax=Leptinotarsa decemlineata TaxID=7539 RepID=UPI003D30461F
MLEDHFFKDENSKRQILRQLNILNIKMDQLSQDISNINLIQSRQYEDPVQQESILDQFQLHLRTEEDLNLFEDFLQNKENISEVVKELSVIGGTNFKVMVKRLMQRVLHDELAILYSWIGFKQKKTFYH